MCEPGLNNHPNTRLTRPHSFDQKTNVILGACHERVYSTDEPVEIVQLGLYVVRGDNIAIIGEVDQEKDEKLDWNKLRGEALKVLRH